MSKEDGTDRRCQPTDEFVLQERPTVAPPVALRLTFYGSNFDVEKADKPIRNIFATKPLFTVKVPILPPNAVTGQPVDLDASATEKQAFKTDASLVGQLRALEDNSPGQRGSPYLKTAYRSQQSSWLGSYHKDWYNERVLRPKTSARIQGQVTSAALNDKEAADSPLLPISQHEEPVPTPDSLIEEWNAMVTKGVQEPWRAPSQGETSEKEEQVDVVGEDDAVHRASIMTALQQFVEQPVPVCKTMIFKHAPYGWDLQALEAKVMQLIREHADQAGPLEGKKAIKGVRITYDSIPPWLALSITSKRYIGLPVDYAVLPYRKKNHPLPGDWLLHLPTAVNLIIQGFANIWFLGDKSRASTVVGLVYLTIGWPLAIVALTMWSRVRKVQCFDTVLLAHPIPREENDWLLESQDSLLSAIQKGADADLSKELV